MAIDFPRVKNRFAAGLPYKNIVSVCREVCLTLNSSHLDALFRIGSEYDR